MMNAGVGLVGDIGATNARFALVQPDGKVTGRRVYALSEHASLADAIDAYLADKLPAAKPMRAALAVAAPVTGHEIRMTNHPWEFTIEALQERFDSSNCTSSTTLPPTRPLFRTSPKLTAFRSAAASRSIKRRLELSDQARAWV